MADARATESVGYVGRQLGEFVVREPLSSGGFGLVFRAEQPGLGREAVVKVLHTRLLGSQTVVQRFLLEAQLASRLDHPYAAHTYASGVEPDGVLWIAMELVRGTPLDQLLDVQGALPVERLVPLLERICEVVHTAHEQGIVHRDLKPANVMVLARAGRLLPKLLDFGIAKLTGVDDPLDATPIPIAPVPPGAGVVDTPAGEAAALAALQAGILDDTLVDPIQEPAGDAAERAGRPSAGPPPRRRPLATAPGGAHERLTHVGAAIGSPLYMAPEQWQDASRADARSDIYALGVLAYQALTGRTPFAGRNNAELAHAHAHLAPPPVGDGLPIALDVVLARALAKRPADRYDDPLEFAAAVRAAAGIALESDTLPHLAPTLRARVLAGAPQPIADALAAYEAARNPHQARESLGRLVSIATRLVGVVALATRAHLGPGRTAALGAAALPLRDGEPTDAAWLELAHAIVAPFAGKREAFPLPELVDFLLGPGRDELAELHDEIAADDGGREDEVRARLTTRLPRVARLLEALGFLELYPLVVADRHGPRSWMGAGRAERRRAAPAAGLPPDRPYLLDGQGAPLIELWPLVQLAEPAPGDPPALFLFDGKGRRGGRMVAWPEGFVREEETAWAALAHRIGGHGGVTADDVGDERCPFPGLTGYRASDADSFFGRERETEASVNRLRIQPLLAVVGPSGAGKSSFVQAGVVPALRAGTRCVTVRPGPGPIAGLVSGLRAAGIGDDGLAARLAGDADALGVELRRHAAQRGAEVVLVVDQFEELFTLGAAPAERDRFAALLVGAARAAEDPVRVIATLRDDFLLHAEALPALSHRLSSSLQLLATPAVPDLERILLEPVRRAGYAFEDPALVSAMVAEVADRPGALALLSFTAGKLWELRDPRFRQLGRRAYESLGGVGGALAQHAEATLAAMASAERRLVREVFRQAITEEGTRAVLRRDDLLASLGDPAHGAAVLEKLIASRLLVTSESEDGERIEIAHEALLVAWPRLVGWRGEDREGARMRDQLRVAAHQWAARGRPEGLLWRGAALDEMRLWQARQPGGLGATERAFADASLAQAARGRRTRTGLLALAFTVLAAGVVSLLVLNARAERLRVTAERNEGAATAGRLELDRALRDQLEDQGRRLLLADDPRQALAYLHRAAAHGAGGPAHDLLVARALQATEGELLRLDHGAGVLRVRFSPDGRRVLTASFDRTAAVWDARDGRRLATLAHGDAVFRAEFSPDGARIATASRDGRATIWDAASGRALHALAAHPGGLATALFSPDGRSLATIGLDDGVKLWDVERGVLRRTLWPGAPAAESAKFAAFSPDGGQLAVGDAAGRVRVWRPTDGRLLATLAGHHARVTWVEYAPAGDRLLTASYDHTIALWDPASGRRLLQVLEVAPVVSASFSPDGRRVAVASEDVFATVRDAATGDVVLRLDGHLSGLTRAFYTPDGARVVTASHDATLALWDAASGIQLGRRFGHQGSLADIAIARDGRRIASASVEGRAIVWDAGPSEPRLILRGHRGLIEEVAASPDGRRLVSAGADGTALVWDAGSGEVLASLSHPAAVSRARFGRGGDTVATGDADGGVRLWDARGGRPLRALDGLTSAVQALAFSPDGGRLAAVDKEQTIVVWSADDGRRLLRFAGGGPVEGPMASWTPDGRRIAVVGQSTARFYGAADGAEVARFPLDDTYYSIAFDPAGARAVSIGERQVARLWRTATGEALGNLTGHVSDLTTAQFDPTGHLIVTASLDGTARVWDAARGEELIRLRHGKAQVWSAGFLPDGRGVATATNDGGVSIWRLPAAPPRGPALERLLRCRVPYTLDDDRLQPRPRDVAACAR